MKQTRRRSRYAPDEQVERAANLAKKHGVALVLRSDGSVEITGKLDSAANDTAASGAEGDNPDDALARWEAGHGHTRHS